MIHYHQTYKNRISFIATVYLGFINLNVLEVILCGEKSMAD